jgi:A/G-specific adenine glycosylase
MKNGFAISLNRWFKRSARPLPWRETTDPYKIWISEVMLQQTTVPTVIAYYNQWIKDYPTVEHVAQAPLEKLLKSWQGLGYYQRVRNIQKAATIFVEQHGRKIPPDYETLRSIPGFGPYTSGAVLSIAFDQRVPIVDANIRRVVMRLLALEKEATTQIDPVVYDYLEGVLPQKNLRTFNQALMELGALICKSKEPLCSMCPVKRHCQAFDKGIQEIIPTRKEKLTEVIDVAVGKQRPARGLLAELWEFPGGKIEKGETPEAALRRELKEELNISIENVRLLTKVKHFYTKYKVNLYAYFCDSVSLPAPHAQRKWVPFRDFPRYAMPSGTAKLVEFLRLTSQS